MREIKVLLWCDACDADNGDDGEQEPATGDVRIAVNAGNPLTLDLCDRHRKALVSPLVDLLQTHGAAVDAPPTSAAPPARRRPRATGPREWQCLWCPNDYAADSGYRVHLDRSHGLPTMPAAYGNACPLCGADYQRGHSYTHGAVNVSQVFVMAREAGDPHGVVAQRLAAGTNVVPT